MLMIHPASRLARDAGAALLPPALFAYGGCDDGATASMAVTTAAGGTLDGPSGTQFVVPAGAVTHPTSLTVAHTQRDAPAQVPGINLH